MRFWLLVFALVFAHMWGSMRPMPRKYGLTRAEYLWIGWAFMLTAVVLGVLAVKR